MTDYHKKFCMECKHFYFSTAEPGYSEVTPGGDSYLTCLKWHWDLENYNDDTMSLRVKLGMARTCDDFEEVEDGD